MAEARQTRVSAGIGLLIAVLGLLALLGWRLDIPFLLHPTPQQQRLPPLSAVLFLLSGLSLCTRLSSDVALRRLAMALASAVLILSLSLFSDYLFPWQLRIEPWLFLHALAEKGVTQPDRPALQTLVSFTLISVALLLASRTRTVEVLALLTSLFPYLALLGYAFGIAVFYQPFQGIAGVSLYTAIGFMLLCIGLLTLQSQVGVGGLLVSETPGGVLLRRLLPLIFVLPGLLGLARLFGQEVGLFDRDVGIALSLALTMALFAGVLVWSANSLDHAERERRSAEASVSRLAAIVESTSDAIISLDLDGQISTWNRGAEEIYGYSAGEIIGHPVTLIVSPDRQHLIPHLIARLKQGERIEPFETAQISKSGRPINVSVRVSTLRDSKGGAVGFSAIARDITEFKRALEDVAWRTAELEKTKELSRIKDHFLSSLSHELKTPLSLITGYAELLQDLGPSKERLDGIQNGVQRLTRQINKILDYSALLSGSLPLYRSEVQLRELIENVQALTAEDLEYRSQTLELELEPGVSFIPGDPARIAQMLTELVSNASKFTPPGGQIGIRTVPGDDMLRIDVWDTGSGISEEQLAKLGEGFSRLDLDEALRSGGLGLGLAIVKLLAELHGGRITVESQVGKGSVFSLYLPLLPAAGSTPGAAAAPSYPA